MNTIIKFIVLSLLTSIAFADTPPAGKVGAWIYDSGGNTLSSSSGALDVNCTNCSGGGGGTVNQGTGGVSPWTVQFSTPQQVTGTFFQSVQPISQSGSFSVLQSGTWNMGRTWTLLNSTDSVTSFEGGTWNVNVSNFPSTQPISGSVSVSNFPSTQPVSGTVTSNQGTAGVSAWKVDGSGVTQPVSGTVAVSNFPGTQAVSGTVTANAGTGTFTVGQSTGANLHADIDNFPATQAISATALPLPTGASTSANQTNGTQQTQIVQGGNTGVVTAAGAQKVDGSAVTQPVSGTVTVNQGTPGGSPWPVSGTFTSAATPDFSGSGSLTAACSTPSSCGAGSTVDLSQNTSSLGNMELEVQGTWVGTILMEGSNDSGANWKSFSVVLPSPAAFSSAGVTSNGYYRTLGVGSFKWIRARMNPYTSGTAVVTLRASVGPDVVGVVQSNPSNLATGAWFNNSGTQVQGASDSSGNQIVNAQGKANSAVQSFSIGTSNPLQTDLRGAQLTVPLDGMRATYSASFGISPATTATDVFTIGGSGSKTVRILQVEAWPSETTAALKQLFLLIRSSANSGGTSSAGTAVPFDSNSPAATAPVTIYSANPTSLGTLVGNIRSSNMNVGPGTTTDPETLVRWDFGNNSGQAVVLRGSSQFLALNLNSVTFTGGSIYVSVTWTEE